MLNIFWEVEEEAKIKREIEKQLKTTLDKLTTYSLRLIAKPDHCVSVIFTSSRKIKRLNKTYRGINKETDVLSFAELDVDKDLPIGTQPAVFSQEEQSLGEIFINYEWLKNLNKFNQLYKDMLGKSPLERGGLANARTACPPKPWRRRGCVNLKDKMTLIFTLFLHGYLHLLGYDHEKDHGKMEKLEEKLRKQLV